MTTSLSAQLPSRQRPSHPLPRESPGVGFVPRGAAATVHQTLGSRLAPGSWMRKRHRRTTGGSYGWRSPVCNYNPLKLY